jgi:hypothetical protein
MILQSYLFEKSMQAASAIAVPAAKLTDTADLIASGDKRNSLPLSSHQGMPFITSLEVGN